MRAPIILIALLAQFVATVAAAQDWAIARANNRVMAYVAFDNGLSIGFRCQGDTLSGFVTGLPEVDPPTDRLLRRRLQLSWGREDRIFAGDWWVTEDTRVAMSDSPAALARRLRQGGDLNLLLPEAAENGANMRYVVTLPQSSQALDTLMTECGQPLEDPHDAAIAAAGGTLPSSLDWAIRPAPRYPEGQTFTGGLARLSCVTRPNGQLADCVVDSEFPDNSGFGEAALRSMRRARLQDKENPGVPIPVVRVTWVATFSMIDDVGAGGVRIRMPDRPPSAISAH